MTQVIAQKEIKKTKNLIINGYRPEKIILFGSYAWGKPNRDSDLDLFIIKRTNIDRHKRQISVRRLLRGEMPVDILVYTPKETDKRLKMGDFFIKDILTKGKIIYEASKS